MMQVRAMFFLSKFPLKTYNYVFFFNYNYYYMEFVLYLNMPNQKHLKLFYAQTNQKSPFFETKILRTHLLVGNFNRKTSNMKGVKKINCTAVMVQKCKHRPLQLINKTATEKATDLMGMEKGGRCTTVKLAPLTFCKIFLRRLCTQ